eukprot:7703938-Pyramimonas_sp.AAC.1
MRQRVDNNKGARMRFAAGGQTFACQQPGTVPTWAPDSAAAQPPSRHEYFFQFFEPLQLRFVSLPEHTLN